MIIKQLVAVIITGLILASIAHNRPVYHERTFIPSPPANLTTDK